MQPRASKDDYDRALDGLEFPASTDSVIRKARDHGGIDTEVDGILTQLPEGSFASREELMDAIRGIYSAAGVEAARIPV
jgi:hypothetical protein